MVQQLDHSQRTWETLGFGTTPRGFHQTGGTANHLIMLEGTYIELLGMADPATPSPYRAMMSSPGLWGIALRGSAEETYRYWREQGLPTSAPQDLARAVEIDGRRELARFRLTMLEPSTEVPFLVFCCEHLTPQFVWRKDRQPHPNGATRLHELVVVADDERALRGIERITARSARRDGKDDSVVTFLSPAAYRSRYGSEADLRSGTSPRLAAVVLTSSDLARAREFARVSGAPTRETAAGGFMTALTQEGVTIEWVPER